MNLAKNLQYRNHNAVVLFENGDVVMLSFSGFKGKEKMQQLGIQGINTLITEAKAVLVGDKEESILKDFFAMVGVENGIQLLSVSAPQEFKNYWAEKAQYLCSKGMGHSFRKTLAFISGTRATLAHLRGNEFVEELRSICENLRKVETPLTIPQMKEKEGIRVAFFEARNNTYIFLVNEKEVSVCSNRVGEILSEGQILKAALDIRHAVQSNAPIKDFTSSWGGSFVLRIMSAVCEEESLAYFQNIAAESIACRRPIEPRKILKVFNFALHDDESQEFVNKLLNLLETAKNESAEELIEGNKSEIESEKSEWALYHSVQGALKMSRLDFNKIKNIKIREEIKGFLRDRYFYDESTTQLTRYFNLIKDALSIFDDGDLSSMKEVHSEHVTLLQGFMSQKGMSVSKISETMQAMRNFFAWVNYEELLNGERSNPFDIQIRNKGRFAKTVEPVKEEALLLAAEHLDELPEYIQIAFLIYASTLARANDVCGIRLSEIEFYDNGESEWRFRAGKNKRVLVKRFTRELTEKIKQYADKTQTLREKHGEDYLLLYCKSGLRKDSLRTPQILNASSFVYHTNKLLEQYSDKPLKITPRGIRAEGGRRLHTKGLSEYDIGQILGNTPKVAEKSYRNLSPHDEAGLYHKAFEAEAARIWGQSEEASETSQGNSSVTMFGKCNSKKECKQRAICIDCGFLCVRKGGNTPWKDK